MSLAALLQPALGRIRQFAFGVKVPGQNGELVDTGVQQLADEFVNSFGPAPIELTQPIVLNNMMSGTPAIIIINSGGGGGVAMGDKSQVVNDGEGNVVGMNANPDDLVMQVLVDAAPTITQAGCVLTINMNLTKRTVVIPGGRLTG